jgi:hypothetical protein
VDALVARRLFWAGIPGFPRSDNVKLIGIEIRLGGGKQKVTQKEVKLL